MMMNRNDCAYIGFGHGGSKIVDGLMSCDARYIGYFINTSMYDIRSLDNYDDITKNYYHIPQADGVGGNRDIGKRYAQKNGWNILDVLKRFDQSTLCFTFSLGGGSGSSIASVVLGAIDQLQQDPEESFEKKVNTICILPRLDSSTQVLKNTIKTWGELMLYKCISNMYFIDNNNTFDGKYLTESEVNEYFIQLFDAMYEMPNEAEDVIDGSDLGTMFTSKGCSYIYELPNGYENAEDALKYAYNHSVLAKMYQNNDNLIIDDDGLEKIRCDYIGTSFYDEHYTHDDVLKLYKPIKNNFKGKNIERNFVLISGCLPPFYPIQVIMAELKDREEQEKENSTINYNKFIIPTDDIVKPTNKPQQKQQAKPQKKNTMKKTMKKKNLFDFIK